MKTDGYYDGNGEPTRVPHGEHVVARIDAGDFKPKGVKRPGHPKCTECGCQFYQEPPKFCPNCGSSTEATVANQVAEQAAYDDAKKEGIARFKKAAFRQLGLTHHPRAHWIWDIVEHDANDGCFQAAWEKLIPIGLNAVLDNNPPIYFEELQAAIKAIDFSQVTTPQAALHAIIDAIPVDAWYRKQLRKAIP